MNICLFFFLLGQCLIYSSRVILSLQALYHFIDYVIFCRSQGLTLHGGKVPTDSREKQTWTASHPVPTHDMMCEQVFWEVAYRFYFIQQTRVKAENSKRHLVLMVHISSGHIPQQARQLKVWNRTWYLFISHSSSALLLGPFSCSF
jgi:hypothetical protein